VVFPNDGFNNFGVSNGVHEKFNETASEFHTDAGWESQFVRSGDVTEDI
jgi:hypothetical protein